MKALLRIASVIMLIILSCGSCRRVEGVVYADYESFDGNGWDPACLLSFSPIPLDSVITTADRYDIVLTLRYSPANASKTLPIEISEEDENGVISTRRVNIHLRKPDGKFRGRKSIHLYEITDTIRRDFRRPDGYIVNLSSLSPAVNTQCLRNLGISMSLSGQ